MVARLRDLRSQLRSLDAPWEIAAPIAYIQEARMLLLPVIGDGQELGRWIRDARVRHGGRTKLLAHMARAAEGLRLLQRTAADGLPTVSPREMVGRLRRATAELHRAAPELAERVGRRLLALEDALDHLPPEPMVPTHGAFRHDQLLACGHKLGVLDLDTLRLSGASADAGNFLAYLDAMAIQRPRLRSLLRDCRNIFTEALSGHPGWLSWYRAASLVKLAIRSSFSLAPGWPETSQALLRTAEERLARPAR